MAELPNPAIGSDDLAAWYKAKRDLAVLKATEMLLRQRIFKHFFPAPKEGTNTTVLPDTYQLKGVHTINRKVVEESMQALCFRPLNEDGTYAPSKLEQQRIDIAVLIKWKPELVIGAYRELTGEQRHLVDQMLVIDAGSPQLSIEPPAKKRGSKKATPDEAAPGADVAA